MDFLSGGSADQSDNHDANGGRTAPADRNFEGAGLPGRRDRYEVSVLCDAGDGDGSSDRCGDR